ncbi:iron-containing alcohol dehydrogenase [Sulfitobacter donghicola]|uniref:Alcohol dehydrogenase 2 n=1 Tax=Sulfitobacter donghicola DSW-25 = KCTC 12864 = JCM 14565 TaxID=1300350 RepID=A0A073IK84_9RHOB|nr:iron-containing alcohol dehydrogenase [Sulfitobacter donghicola]KEJ90154.1 alcohol dehydrogenase [Sulfitobacter donghicola DSW-25 = KCTC 12864 = JCM 14565]KIN66688.1 Iron-containing alcohol dehydrogenase [Sulfitobacter donghicola DSW-25 = KCTC 12864 = JCM 14565]
MTLDGIGRVQSPRVIRIGAGVAQETAEVLAQLGLSRPLIVTDKNLVSLGHVQTVTDVLDKANLNWAVFDGVIEDPTDTCLDEGIAAFRKDDFDCIIGLGGGSPMDTAKAISFMSVNEGHVREYKAPYQIDKCGPPVILIPTTGGTGSELTRWCVITDTKETEKYNLSGLACVATAALIDWTFTTTKPWRITADTAVDSLTHAIEAYVSRKSFAYTDAFALAAMPAIANNVRAACADPENGPAREALMLAASQAGMAFSNASVALVHGMSRPIGAHFHVAHGLSNAMLLPEITKFSVSAAEDRYATCARVMGWASDGDSDALAAGKLVENLTQLNADLKVPSPRDLGHKEDTAKFEIMAAQALASGSPQNNPRVPRQDEIVQLYQNIWAG